MIALKIRFDRLKQMLFVVNKVIDTGTQSTLVNHGVLRSLMHKYVLIL